MKYLLLLSIFFPLQLFAQAQVFPTRLTLSEETPSSYLNLKNASDKPQKYRIELAQFLMKKDGHMEKADVANNPLLETLKFSPKVIEVAPNEKQVVRVMVTGFENLGQGDYYIYLHFIPDGETPAAGSAGKSNKFTLQAKIAVAVPVIVRHGPSKVDGKLTDVAANKDNAGNINVSFKLTNSSKYFLTGDLEVVAISDKGEVSLSKVIGLSSYIPERIVTSTVSQKELTEKLHGDTLKKIKVRYVSSTDSGGPFDLSGETDIGTAGSNKSNKKTSKRR